MNPDLTKLDQALKAVAPVDGVSVGVLTDKTTWRVDFQTTATDAQKAAAQAVIDNCDLTTIFAAPRVWTPYEFYQKFTAAERAALKRYRDDYMVWRGYQRLRMWNILHLVVLKESQ